MSQTAPETSPSEPHTDQSPPSEAESTVAGPNAAETRSAGDDLRRAVDNYRSVWTSTDGNRWHAYNDTDDRGHTLDELTGRGIHLTELVPVAQVAELERLRLMGEQKLAKVMTERDSLARRCAVRYEATEKERARAETAEQQLAELRGQRDAIDALAEDGVIDRLDRIDAKVDRVLDNKLSVAGVMGYELGRQDAAVTQPRADTETLAGLGSAPPRAGDEAGNYGPGQPRPRPRRLNGPMVERLRKCATDPTPSWDGAISIYPPEARGLVALIDATATLVRCANEFDPDEREMTLRAGGCGWCGADHIADLTAPAEAADAPAPRRHCACEVRSCSACGLCPHEHEDAASTCHGVYPAPAEAIDLMAALQASLARAKAARDAAATTGEATA